MKFKALTFILIIFVILSAFPVTAQTAGKEIYVSVSNGNDGGNGTKESPYLTIDRARQAYTTGDTIVLQSGVYHNTLVFWETDCSAQAPYIIKGEEGADVTISSYDPIISSWEKYSGNIFRTNIGIMDDVAHALWFNNGEHKNLVEARWPNAPADDVLNMERKTMDEGSDHYGLYDDELPDGDWNDATVYLWTGYEYEQYVSYARTITDYKAGESLKFSSYVGEESVTYTPQKGNWYYLTNSLSGLDVAREYYYDKETGYFYVIMPDGKAPESGEIQIKTRSNAVELWGSSFVTLKNINMLGGVVVHESDNCVFDNVNVYYSDFFRTNDGYNTHVNVYNSTRFYGDNNTWKNSEIAYTMSSGLLINGDGNTVVNCDIHDVAMGGGYNAAISIEGNTKNNTISHNNLYKSGRFLIYFINTGIPGDGYENTVIEYNDCHNAMYLTRDGGVIYGYHRNGKGVTIRNNWVHDSMRNSCGIYLDNNCSNFIVRNNVVWNVSEAGIVINTNSIDNQIYRNTVFDCGEGIQGWPKTEEYSQKGMVIANNAINPTADFIVGANAPTLISNVFKTDFKIDENFLPTNSSPLINAGTELDYMPDVYEGSAPDAGAYELGGYYWIPGTFDKTKSGDVNFDSDIDLKDILSLRKKLANYNITTDFVASDVDGNGKVDISDLLILEKYLVKYDVDLFERTV